MLITVPGLSINALNVPNNLGYLSDAVSFGTIHLCYSFLYLSHLVLYDKQKLENVEPKEKFVA